MVREIAPYSEARAALERSNTKTYGDSARGGNAIGFRVVHYEKYMSSPSRPD